MFSRSAVGTNGLSLDLKLGARMLVKYPGLTVVGSIAMAFAIWVGALVFEAIRLFLAPSLPLPGGDRIVHIRNWNIQQNQAESRALYDFILWKQQLKSVADLGAFREAPRNLGTDGQTQEVQGVEISASAFRVASAKPLLGRGLTTADEQPGAPAVAVIGHDIWVNRFASDPSLVGKSVRVGDGFATIVGVMPQGFAFPISHELWMPLRIESLDKRPLAGPSLTVFGRLADGATLEGAQRELDVLGQRSARDFPRTHEHLKPRVAQYATLIWDPARQDTVFMNAMNLFAVALLVLICGNVALLLFARAATRETELMVRSALGASRGRIVMQLFAEALVLGLVSAVVGLAATAFTLERWGGKYLEVNFGRMPFWYDVHLSAGTVVYALVLTGLAAAVAGVIPALKVTRDISAKLRQNTAGSGVRFSGVWTAVIVAQVAATVVFPFIVFLVRGEHTRVTRQDIGFAAQRYLTVRVDLDPPQASWGPADTLEFAAELARQTAKLERLRQVIAGEPGIRGVAFIEHLPRGYHPSVPIHLADSIEVGPGVTEVSYTLADAKYFQVLGAPVVAGRGFHSGDLGMSSRTIIVDQGFVDLVLRGRTAVGRRVRIGDGGGGPDSLSWFEIVGVVKELGMQSVSDRYRVAGMYLPMGRNVLSSVSMVVHTDGEPMAIVPRIRTLANGVDPNLRLNEFVRMDHVIDGQLWFIRTWVKLTAFLTAIALLLSLAGIYAVLAFTVARRTREIGVRVALGASPRKVVAAIFRKPLTQVAIGVVLGAIIVGAGTYLSMNSAPPGRMVDGRTGLSIAQVAALMGHAALMMGVCMLACIVPTRRALNVEPTEALRAE